MANASELLLQHIETNMNLLKNFKLPESLKNPNSTYNNRPRIVEDINSVQEINRIATYLKLTPIDLKPYIDYVNDFYNYPFSKVVLVLIMMREKLEVLKGECDKKISEKLEKALESG